jgi:hypothetical protein
VIADARIPAFLDRLRLLPAGYGEGVFAGRRYGVPVTWSDDRRRCWLYGEELGGGDRVSFNLYLLRGGRPALRPCEMPAEKVIDFVLNYEPRDGPPDQRDPTGLSPARKQ